MGTLAYIYPIGTGTPGHPIELPPGLPGHLPAPGRPGRPSHPIVLPPLPGVWPKPGEPSHPIEIPPPVEGEVSPPIFIPEDPQHPIVLPPGTVWPPLPPDFGFAGKTAILIWISGVGSRWYIYDPTLKPTPSK